MEKSVNIRASVLVTTAVIGLLMSLVVLGVIALWDIDRLFFARMNYLRNQRGYLESGFVLYAHDKQLATRFDEEGGLQLFDSLTASRIFVNHKVWGLYEAVTVHTHDRRMGSVRLFGSGQAGPDVCTLYYPDNNPSFTITGRTNLKGKLLLPKNGIQYGQMQSIYFSGERTANADIGQSGSELPAPTAAAFAETERLFGLLDTLQASSALPDSVGWSFFESEAIRFKVGSGVLTECSLRGQVILVADRLLLAGSCRAEHIIVIARSVTIESGFRGRVQLLVRDSVHLKPGAVLKYPSGILLRNPENTAARIILEPYSEVNGYVIAFALTNKSIEDQTVLYTQARSATVRGLLYINGLAQVQGIVSGTAYLRRARYNSSHARYDDLLYDLTLLTNHVTAYPFWLDTPYPRKEAIWLD